MPPSAAAGSSAASPATENEADDGTGGFTDDAVATLGAALAGVRVGNDSNENGAFGNHLVQGLPGGGASWGSGSTAAVTSGVSNGPG